MSPKRKILLSTTVALLTGLALIEVSPKTHSDQAQHQSRAGASPAKLETSTQSRQSASPADEAFVQHARSKTGTILDEKLTELEQKSLWQALSEARREVREIPEAWADRKENFGYDFYALHPKQQLTARFGAREVQFVSSERTYTEADTCWEAKMSLRVFAGREVAAESTAEKVAGSRVEYQRAPGLTEWYDNGTEAMEHGFTVSGRPGHLAAKDEVVIAMRLDGLAAAERDTEGQSLAFRDGEREVLSYEKLLVFDASGKKLSARMEPTEDGFLIAYHDAGATYPVTVDPLIVNQEAKFNRFHAAPGDRFGQSVSVFGDTVVIGALSDDDGGTDSGSAFVFIRSGGNWTLQDKLTASDAAAGDQFGISVSVSGDTVIVGAHQNDDDGSNSGSAYIFTRSGSSWSQQAKLIAADDAAGDQFGVSVSLSGETVVIGANQDDSGRGSAYVFTRSGGSWSQQQKLTASDAAVSDEFGYSVAVSGDTVVVGAYWDDALRGSAYVFTLSGGIWSQQQKLTAADAAAGDRFGYALAVSGNTVIVGAPRDDDGGDATGSTYVFTRSGSTWSQQQKLTAADRAEADQFGYSVSVSGDTLIAGAYANDDGGESSGSAYVFTRSGGIWSQQEKLIASDAAANDQFGWSVAVSGDTVIVGADQDDNVNGGTNSGSAYVFARSGVFWTQQAKLNASDAAVSDQFGWSVAISGNTLIVGSAYDDDGGIDSGSAYVFIRNGSTWRQQAKLTAPDAALNDLFGQSVSISGNTVVVGAYGDDDGGQDSGSAYVFARSGSVWTQRAKLAAADAAAINWFGYAVSISGDTVVVGAHYDDQRGFNSGSAYVFTRSGSSWSQQAKLTASDGAMNDLFGYSVSVSGATVLVGAYGGDDGGTDAGSAYVFTRSGSNWSQQAKLIASDREMDDLFGYSVAVSGDTVVVGAYRDVDSRGYAAGSAYVFVRSGSTWSQQAKLTASDVYSYDNDKFGKSVAVSGDTVVVGAEGANAGDILGSNIGSAYVFTRSGSTWTHQAKLTASDSQFQDSLGWSVSVSSDTVVAGAYGDDDGGSDSGSVYVYRLAVPGVRELLVSDHLGNPLANSGTASPFEGQRVGTSANYFFTVTNVGALGLDLQSFSLGGADAAQFSLGVPAISNNPDLAQGEALSFTVTFNPVGGSGARHATLSIVSNDPGSPYVANLSGLGLSNSQDGDNDGMNDWAEYDLRGFGFDWQKTQSNLVSDYHEKAPSAGLVTLEQVGGLKAGTTLLDVNLSTNRAKFAIELKQSNDLVAPFSPIVANPARLSVDAQGRIVYEVDAPVGKSFYLMEVKP